MRFIVKRIKSILTTSQFLGFLKKSRTLGHFWWTQKPWPLRDAFLRRSFLALCGGRSASLSLCGSQPVHFSMFCLATTPQRLPSEQLKLFLIGIDEWAIHSLLFHFPSFLHSLLPTSKMSTLRKGINWFQLSVCLLMFSSWGKFWHF